MKFFLRKVTVHATVRKRKCSVKFPSIINGETLYFISKPLAYLCSSGKTGTKKQELLFRTDIASIHQSF